MAGKTALNKEMKHLNGAYFRTININNTNKYENENLFKNAADSLCYHIGADILHE